MVRCCGAAVFLLALAALGCESPSPKGDLSGKVLLDGEPLPAAYVTVVCEGKEKALFNATVRNGTYNLKGVPVGPAKIGVSTFTGLGAPPGKFVAIPARYSDPAKSGLTCTVGEGEQTLDLRLEGEP